MNPEENDLDFIPDDLIGNNGTLDNSIYSKRVTFARLARLIELQKEQTDNLVAQLEKLQNQITEDKSVTKEAAIGNVVISFKFLDGVPQIPLDSALAINLAATNLISRLATPGADNKIRTTNVKPLDLGEVRNIIRDNEDLDHILDA